MKAIRPMDQTSIVTTKTVQRRGFFAAVGVATAAMATGAAKPAEAMTPTGTKAGAHYTESEHVKQYYRVNQY